MPLTLLLNPYEYSHTAIERESVSAFSWKPLCCCQGPQLHFSDNNCWPLFSLGATDWEPPPQRYQADAQRASSYLQYMPKLLGNLCSSTEFVFDQPKTYAAQQGARQGQGKLVGQFAAGYGYDIFVPDATCPGLHHYHHQKQQPE